MKFDIRSEIVSRSKPQRFREGGRLHRNVRIYLEPENQEDIEKIKFVEYELHPTFRDRYRTSSDTYRNFEIRIWTYGYFKIKAKIIFKDDKTETVEGFVRWRVPKEG